MTTSLTLSLTVKAAAKVVFDMLTKNDLLVEWFCDSAEVNARSEGYLFVAWVDGYHASGKFTAFEKNVRLALALRANDENADGQVEIALKEDNASTTVALTHHNAGAAWQRLWERGLENLQSHLETGYDLRETRRPLMGVNISGELTEERIAKLGLPVNKGVLLEGTIANMSAAAAGLKANDLIVSLDGKAVDDFPMMSKAIREAGYRAGDSVEVEFYRGAEKHKVTLTYALREIAPIPTPEEYATKLETLHAELEPQLRALLKGVPQDVAAQRPAKDEWSAKETVAHLVLGQRWIVQFIGDRLAGQEPADWSANNLQVVTTLAQSYDTVDELLDLLKRERGQTVTLIRAIPEEFLQKRGSWNRMHEFTNFLKEHDAEHREQITKALEAARVPA
jgi:uncharacterized protein YndB with AHSA1/START domain